MWTITTSLAAWWRCMLESSVKAHRRHGDSMKFWSVILVAVLAFTSFDADAARRLGGGGSIGRQSGNVTQREATRNPSAPNNAQNPANPAAQPGAPAANPAAAAPRRPWGAMLGGLAAGLGLA